MKRGKKGLLLYTLIVEKMREYADIAPNTISFHQAKYVISKFNYSKDKRQTIIFELVELGYLERVNHMKLVINMLDLSEEEKEVLKIKI